ncbi:MAG: hypothetical protein M3N93_05090 [Acidobacteriota bacterium]|nr:hypothetical protein [Acidobacteriota bacterium]
MSGLLRALVVYGVLNAAAYSCLLPLWEGFDEGFHYGYVQLLSTTGSFPVLGRASLSRNIWRSYELTPVSHYLQPYTRAPLNFGDYSQMTESARQDLRHRLMSLPPNLDFEPQPDKPNYEVNQSPLPYIFMAAADRALFSFPLPTRVLFLRLICSFLAILFITHSSILIAREIALPEAFLACVLFCVFSSQMLLAVISHVCNDGFAVPAMAYLIWTAIRAARTGTVRAWAGMGIALSAALLIKAYFLFLLPLPVCVLAWNFYKGQLRWRPVAWFMACALVPAAPWYARNMVLYRSISGTVESTSGLGAGMFLSAALKLPWLDSIRYMAHSSLWTGNNSFTTFSATTLNILLLLLASATLLYLRRAKRDPAELLAAASILLFSCGVAFISVAFFSATHGAAIAAVPWYQQVLLPPVLMLAFLGAHRARRFGVPVSAALLLLWAYILVATYWTKLIPLYSGFPEGRARPGQLWQWYIHGAPDRESILRTLCLAPAAVIWILIGSVTALSLTLCGVVLSRLFRRPESQLEQRRGVLKTGF